MRVLLVGNYVHDGSFSMQLFAKVLYRELKNKGIDVTLISPRPFFGKICIGYNGVGKWLGYIDRFILFPLYLNVVKNKYDVVHFCDHGSSLYARNNWRISILVTCHDMLAVRGAMGEIPDCKPSRFGSILQRMVVKGMKKSDRIACVSNTTMGDVVRILKRDKGVCVVSNGLNYAYKIISDADADRILQEFIPENVKYVMHVGTNLPRKNRHTVIRAFSEVSRTMDMYLVIVGRALDSHLLELARFLNVEDRIIQIARPSAEVLEALYNKAIALLFPSKYEGFGWPVIEAQACGCPVIASNIAPFVEILKDTAMICETEAYEDMARCVVSMCTNSRLRQRFVEQGIRNANTNYTKEKMINGYVELYKEMM